MKSYHALQLGLLFAIFSNQLPYAFAKVIGGLLSLTYCVTACILTFKEE